MAKNIEVSWHTRFEQSDGVIVKMFTDAVVVADKSGHEISLTMETFDLMRNMREAEA